MWLGYQLYTTAEFYVYRYAGRHNWATTESRLSTVLSNVRESSHTAYLKDECGLIMIELSRTFVDSQAEGRNMVQALVAGCDDENTTSP